MNESEIQLENLVRELKEMSQTIYPSTNYLLSCKADSNRTTDRDQGTTTTTTTTNGSVSNNNTATTTSSSHSTFNGGGLAYQDFGPLFGSEEVEQMHNTSR